MMQQQLCFSTFKHFTLEDIIGAGFVLTSTKSITCYSCLLLIKWSEKEKNFLATKETSPWSFHAEYGALSGTVKCVHFQKCLDVANNRMFTFPKRFYISGNNSVLKSSDYANAGYYCSAWNDLQSKATVKCHQECGITFEIFARVRYQ